MDNDLAGLTEEVRRAVLALDDSDLEPVWDCWQTVRAELLRLPRENADLRRRITTEGMCELSAGNPALAEYARHWEGRTERAESERDALRKRIDDAPTGIYKNGIADQGTVYTHHFSTQSLIGKRVAVVPLDDAEG